MVFLPSSKNIEISRKNPRSNAEPSKINRKHQLSHQKNSLSPTCFLETQNKDRVTDIGTSNKNLISLKTISFPILSNTKSHPNL